MTDAPAQDPHLLLEDLLSSQYHMPDPQRADFLSIGQLTQLKAKSHFIQAGDVPRKIGLVLSGIFRFVYLHPKGQEYTKGIVTEGHFISSYSAMVSGSPSHFLIEALEDAVVFEIPYSRWVALMNTHPYWDKFLVRLLERAYAIKERRERELLLLDAETRYLHFRQHYPGLENRIKQQIIASFLGIQPESLSRIRRKFLS